MTCPKCINPVVDDTLFCYGCGRFIAKGRKASRILATVGKSVITAAAAVMLLFLTTMAVSLTSALIWGSAYGMNAEELTENIGRNTSLIVMVADLIALLVILLASSVKKKSPVARLKVFFIRPAHVICFIVLGILLNYAVSVTVSLLPIPEAVMETHAEEFSYLSEITAADIINTVFMTGIMEEIVFRAVMILSLRKIIGRIPAVIVSAVIFSVSHGSLVSMGYSLLLGLLLGAVFVRYESVVPCIICHMAFNGASYLIAEVALPAEIMAGLYFTSIVLILLLIWYLVVKYPSAYDLLLDFKKRIRWRNEREKAVIENVRAADIDSVSADDFVRLTEAWREARRWTRKPALPEGEDAKPEKEVTENGDIHKDDHTV